MSEEQNPYQSSESSTAPPETVLPAGTLEGGRAGQYDYTIGKIFKASWDLTADFSAWFTMVVTLIVFYAATFGISYLLGLAGLDGQKAMEAGKFPEFIGLSFLAGLIALPITGPLGAGLSMIGIRRAQGLPISIGQLFIYYPKIIPVAIVGVAFTALNLLALAPLALIQFSEVAGLGFVVTIPLTIYLSVSYMFAIPLVVDKDLSPFDALETSRKAISARFFKNLWLVFVIALFVVGFGIVTCALGLFFSIPFMIVFLGVLYRVIFGVTITA